MSLRDVPPELLVAIAAVFALIAAVVVLATLARGVARRARIHARATRATEGEREAIALLRARGFTVIGSQVVAEYPVLVDGDTVLVGLRADYVVEKRGARFVAEVKTGALAPRIETAATRRQLLEYEVAFEADGILLVDAEAERVHEIVFPTLEARAPRSRRKIAI